jgi:hypothetical protein
VNFRLKGAEDRAGLGFMGVGPGSAGLLTRLLAPEAVLSLWDALF